MRSKWDRIRHAVCFELIGLAIFIPLFSLVLDQPVDSMGVIGVMSATAAMVWNYIYNVGFDRMMQRLAGHTHKPWWLRVLHAIGFEGGLVFILIPPIAWYLGISLMDALLMDVGIIIFYLTYAFFYNLAYDRVFPVPEQRLA